MQHLSRFVIILCSTSCFIWKANFWISLHLSCLGVVKRYTLNILLEQVKSRNTLLLSGSFAVVYGPLCARLLSNSTVSWGHCIFGSVDVGYWSTLLQRKHNTTVKVTFPTILLTKGSCTVHGEDYKRLFPLKVEQNLWYDTVLPTEYTLLLRDIASVLKTTAS